MQRPTGHAKWALGVGGRRPPAGAAVAAAASLLAAACGAPPDGRPRRGPVPGRRPPEARPRPPRPEAAAPRPATARPRVVVLGDSLTAGSACAARRPSRPVLQERIDARASTSRWSTPASPATRRPAACGGSTGRSTATSGCWSSRSAPTTGCAGCRSSEMQENLTADHPRARERASPCCCAAWKRRRTSGRSTPRAFRKAFSNVAARAATSPFVPFLLDRRRRHDGAEPGRRHPPNARRRAAAWPTRVWPALQPVLDPRRARDLMIELRGVSKTVHSGGWPLTILHPLDLDVPAGRASPSSARPAAASRRCSA